MLKSCPTTLSRLCSDDSGAVTVDWVVLTAALGALALALIYFILEAATDPSTSLAATLAAQAAQ